MLNIIEPPKKKNIIPFSELKKGDTFRILLGEEIGTPDSTYIKLHLGYYACIAGTQIGRSWLDPHGGCRVKIVNLEATIIDD